MVAAFAAASALLTHLDGPGVLPESAANELRTLGVDLTDAAYKLANTIPQIISIGLNMNESREVLAARIDNIVSAMNQAKLPSLPPTA